MIDLEDHTYVIPDYRPIDGLKLSVSRIGIIDRPHLKLSGYPRLVPVIGFRRLLVARELGFKVLQVEIIDESAAEADCYEFSFWESVGKRRLDTASKAETIKRLMELFPRSEVVERFLPPLEIPPRGPRIERMLRIASLTEQTLAALASGRILERTADAISFRTQQEQKLLTGLALRAGLNCNKASDTIEKIIDIAISQGKEVGEILERAYEHGLDLTNSREKIDGEHLRNIVNGILDPDYESARADYQRWLSELDTPHWIKVSPATSLEDPSINISIRAENRESAEALLSLARNRITR
jgi:hypothetical protein